MKPENFSKLIASLYVSVLLTACGGSSSDSQADSSDNSDTSGSGASGSDNTPAGTDPHLYTTLDATDSTQAAKLELASGHTVTDAAWQVAYQKYVGFKLNGGVSGDGAVEGCIGHQHDALFDEGGDPVVAEFEKLNKNNTASSFAAVNKSSCTDFTQDSIKTVIELEDWLSADYSQGAPVYAAVNDDDNGWIIRSATKESATDSYHYARVKVKNVTIALGATASRQVTLSAENWDNNTQTFSAAVDSPVLDFSNQRVYWDMETNSVVDASEDWELSLVVSGRQYLMQVNGGASGSGSGGVGILQVDHAGLVSDPTDTAQVYKYFGDSVEGILAEPGNYGPFQYSVAGQHKQWPTFATYVLKEGERYFKMQVISNYGEAGADPSSNLYLRYKELTD